MTVPDQRENVHSPDSPLFMSEHDGSLSTDVLELATTRRFRLDKLALSLANPWLEEEIAPDCPWEGVRRVDRPVNAPAGRTDPDELATRFQAAVAAALGQADVAVVLYSGGIDSTAVLVHAAELCRRDGRRLIPVTWDLSDESGEPSSVVAQRVLDGLGLEYVINSVPARWRGLPEPSWSPAGPRHDYYTQLYQATVAFAAARGAQVILSGEGGDEVLGAWSFLGKALARAGRLRDLWRYLRGFLAAESIVAVAGEAIAAGRRLLPPAMSLRLYNSLTLSRSLHDLDPPVLTPEFDELVRPRRRDWLRARGESFTAARGDWGAAELWNTVFPFAYRTFPATAGITMRSPFLDRAFIEYALGLPPAQRFSAIGPYPYHWYKALHFRLLPDTARAVLPRAKQDYYHEFRRYSEEMLPDGPCLTVDLGLLRPLTRAQLRQAHPRLPIVVRNIEQWMAGALAMGAQPCAAPR